MSNVLEVEQSQQRMKILAPYALTKFKKEKPYYCFNWNRNGWEQIYIWDTTPRLAIPDYNLC